VSEDAGIEPRTVATTALAVRRSNHTENWNNVHDNLFKNCFGGNLDTKFHTEFFKQKHTEFHGFPWNFTVKSRRILYVIQKIPYSAGSKKKHFRGHLLPPWQAYLWNFRKIKQTSCVMEVNRKSFHAVKKGYIVRPFLGKCRN
jgi:hypothetical protein